MTRWNIVISEETDRQVRSYLASFVDRAVRQAIFWETVETIWERNKHLSAEEAQALADEVVDSIRANSS